MKYIYTFSIFLLSFHYTNAQKITSSNVIDIDELSTYLKSDVRSSINKNNSQEELAAYMRNQFSERFFYNYTSVAKRLTIYNDLYSNESSHKDRAMDHMGKYADSTQWVLPFNYLNGDPVNSYALRHLARQHKMVDVALLYFQDSKDTKYIDYFTNQMRSLNVALEKNKYETIEDGNGVYEAFRSGYRVSNWLWIHNLFLNEPAYSDADQLQTIATLLQHGQDLYERNAKFKAGNHQTRGMAALTMLSILLRDFEGTDLWYERGMKRLGEHLDKEINDDGFQFERSIHYHMSDINTYFFVYQLAKKSNIKLDKNWEEKLKTLFTSLAKVAYPDKSAPVLQDDTDNPWAETNDISGAMTLGYLLFESPKLGYFATDKVESRMYWFLSDAQIELLKNIEREKPTTDSYAFTDTKYYITREGWNTNDKMMIISAGVDTEKPDHQHGDILGIQAMANGQSILPNYQVRYSLTDFDLFKNSMVKNVALVDNELQGKQWTGNKGGSGFGKFKELPQPEIITWKTIKNFDLFVGSHDGFKNKEVDYSRQVIYIKDDFWIVKDNFKSTTTHDYKQVWQGHYTKEADKNILRASFPDASGFDILQLQETDTVTLDGARGKQWNTVVKKNQKDFSFITMLYPYRGYNNRIDETKKSIKIKGWEVNNVDWEVSGEDTIILTQDKECYAFNVTRLKQDSIDITAFAKADLFISQKNDLLSITNLGDKPMEIRINKREKTMLKPGKTKDFKIN